jgi:hypothetical protein
VPETRLSTTISTALQNTRANITYEELAARLKPHGVTENAASIANKLARGTFAAAFFLACLAALELEGVRLEDI